MGRYVDGEVDSQRVSLHNKGVLELESWSRARVSERVLQRHRCEPHIVTPPGSGILHLSHAGLSAQASRFAWQYY